MSSADSMSHDDTNGESVDNVRAEHLRDQIIADTGAALAVPIAFLGDKLGLFAALGSGEAAATSAQRAQRAGRAELAERYAVVDVLNPLGRPMATGSVFGRLPSGPSAPPAMGLGNQAGTRRTAQIANAAIFQHTRIATSTPFNLVYELRP
jgi:hypothetical protein